MRKTAPYILSILATGLFLTACGNGSRGKQETPRQVDTIAMLVSRVEKCSRLYTAEYKVHKIITHSDEIRVKGKLLSHDYDVPLPLGERKIAIPMDATIKAYVDMEEFSKSNIIRDGEKLRIILPDPHVELTSTKIGHTEIKKDVAFLRTKFTDAELSAYEQQGREAIINDIPAMGIQETSRRSAAKVLVPLFASMGFKEENITVSFQKNFTASEIIKFVDSTTTVEGR